MTSIADGDEVVRFWVSAGASYDAERSGWLEDPLAEPIYGYQPNAHLVRTSELLKDDCTVLLGEPGMGKSHELKNLAAANLNGANNTTHVDTLGDFASEEALERSVLSVPTIEQWVSDERSTLTLVLDGLDEGLMRIPTLSRYLARRLRAWPCDRLRLVLACRSAHWPASLADDLNEIFDRAVEVYDLCPLRKKDVAAFLSDAMLSSEFIADIERARATAFAFRPLTLKLLAKTYSDRGELPDHASELYEAGLHALCEETNQERRDSGGVGRYSPSQLLGLATSAASLTVYSARPSIWRGPDQSAAPDDMTTDIIRQTAPPAAQITADMVNDLLDCALFTGQGSNRLIWAHATYPDFLAGRWLVQNELDTKQVRNLLCGSDGRVYPQVQNCAAWAVAIDPLRFGWLVEQDPVSFLGEVDIPDSRLKAKILDGLAETARRGEFPSAIWRLDSQLNHDGLADQLRGWLADPEPGLVQFAAILAGHNGVEAVVPELATVAMDSAIDIGIRVDAARAVCRLSQEGPSDVLLPLARDSLTLTGEPTHDVPTLELAVAAWLSCWPHAMSSEEILSHLRPLAELEYLWDQSYLFSELADRLRPSDVPFLAGWLVSLGENATRAHLAPLVNRSVELMMHKEPEHAELAAVAHIACQRASNHEPLFGPESKGPYSFPADARHRLALAIFADCDRRTVISLAHPVPSHGLGILTSEDFGWLIAQYPGSTGRTRENLAQAIRLLHRPGDLEQVDIVLSLEPTDDVAVEVLSEWRNSVRLDSAEAEKQRTWWHEIHGLDDEPEKVPDEWVNPRIQLLIEQAAAGDTDSFWQACVLVAIRPGTSGYLEPHQPDLTAHPRWQELSESTRAAFNGAALIYVNNAVYEIDPGQAITTHRPARAGYIALIQLVRERPEALKKIDAAVWRRWAPIITSWPATINGAQWADKEHILSLAIPHARKELTNSILLIVDQAIDKADHLYARQEIDYLWSHELADELKRRIVDGPPEPVLGELVDRFLRHDREAVRDVLHGWLGTTITSEEVDRAVVAARALMEHDAGASIDALVSTMRTHADVFEGAVRRMHQPGKQIIDWPGWAAAELYIWLDQHFPPIDQSCDDLAPLNDPAESWRQELLSALCSRGTVESLRAVEHIAESLTHHVWLRRAVTTAKNAVRLNQWQPLSPTDLGALTNSSKSRLIRTESDLLQVIVDAFAAIQSRLQGDTPDAQLLWDTRVRQPKTEDEVSDYLRNRLGDDLTSHGVVVNREVQVRRIRPAGIPERTDLRFDAIPTNQPMGKSGSDLISIACEVKGCWNRELPTAMSDQLVERYMKDIGTTSGVYVVLWFDTEWWQGPDDRRSAVAGLNKLNVTRQLEEQAESLRQHLGVTITSIVLDVSYLRPGQMN